jgi:Effector protein
MKASATRRPSVLPTPPVRLQAAREEGEAVVPTASPAEARDLDAWLSSASRFGHRLSDLSVGRGARVAPPRVPFPGRRPLVPLRRGVAERTPTARAAGSIVSSAFSGQAAPIQRLIDEDLVHENLAETSLRQWIQTHNQREDPGSGDKETEKAYLHSQLEDLDNIEHEIYQRFGQSHDDSPERTSMFKLLDQVQEHHRELIDRTSRGGHELWVKGDVDFGERERINQVWGQVVANQGNLSVERTVPTDDGTAQVPGQQYGALRKEVLSDMARLMSRPKGRKLVEHLHTQGQDDSRQVKLRMHNLGALKKGAALSPLASKLSNEAVVRESDGGIVKGKGSGAVVSLTPGLKDSDFSDFGPQGQRIPSPTFVSLGHELTHSAHFQRGTSAEGVESNEIPSLSAEEGYEGDMEELLTIERTEDLEQMKNASVSQDDGKGSLDTLLKLNKDIPTEDDIREEHGLGLRFGHTTMATPERYPESQKGSDPADFVERPQQIAKDIESANRPWYKDPKVWTGGALLLALAASYGPDLYRKYMGQ